MKRPLILGIIVIVALWALYAFYSASVPSEPHDSHVDPSNGEDIVDRFPGWEVKTQEEVGATFRYPSEFGTTYITPVDWPPQLMITNEPFSCTPAGETIDRAGKTTIRSIEGRDYCVTQLDEGAAGSVYTQYAYAFAHDSRTAVLTFTLRAPQCANYDDPERSACEEERDTFAIDPLIDTIIRSIEFVS